MFDRLAFRIAVPMVVISLLLLGLGTAAAWNVQRQQVLSQNLIVGEMEGLLAMQGVYMRTREILYLLQRHQRTGDEELLSSVMALKADTEQRVAEAQRWPRTDDEKQLMQEISRGYQDFWRRFDRLRQLDDSKKRDRDLVKLTEDDLLTHVIEPAENYMRKSHDLMARTNEASRYTTDLTRQGFLLLGLCGCTGGLVAGWGVAKVVQRSLVRLDISVRSVADRLGAVAGPVTFTQVGDLHELEAGLSQMELHVVELVQRLQLSELQRLRNEQLASLGQLAAGLAHELRNPLMPIKTLVQTALERGPERGLSGQSLVVIDREIQRMEHSLQTFLDFARPPDPAKTKFNLSERLQQTVDLVSARAAQQQITIQLRLPEAPLWIKADSGQIQQVLLNLLLNAMDALPTGGEIDLSARRERAGPAGEQVVLTITDNGPGVPPDVLEHVFEPFVTTKETGTGLGLPICQRLILAHGGTIEAHNRPSGGAEFVVTLPVHEVSPPDTADRTEPAAGLDRGDAT